MSVTFKKRLIDDVKFEAVAVFDVNNDGIKDIVCGEHWYEGPDFVNCLLYTSPSPRDS